MKRTLRNILLILPALCLISLIFSVRASAAAISSSHWVIDFADYCMNRGIISATRSTFSPDEEYKRWELAKAFTKAEGYNPSDRTETGFSDISYGATHS